MYRNSDLRIAGVEALSNPAKLARQLPVSDDAANQIGQSRSVVNQIILGQDQRLLAVVGPCSIHNPQAALEYAGKLKALADESEDVLYIVMRTYFEKPRTIGGWKGLIVDPWLDGSYDIEQGITIARKLLLDITSIGLPVGCELLDPIVPQYIDELLSWCAIGARTTESQTHRTLASGMSVAVGFKNSTSGDLTPAVNAIKSSRDPAAFIGMDKEGNTSIFRTTGNECGHLILRGGDHAPNYYEEEVEHAVAMLKHSELFPSILVDCSHANSRKDPRRQRRVLRSVIDQVVWGQAAIRGFMLESNLFAGSQAINGNFSELEYGVSITDGCLGWEETEDAIRSVCKVLRSDRKKMRAGL